VSFKEFGKRPTSSPGSFKTEKTLGTRLGKGRFLFGLPHGICPRFSRCIFLLLKLRDFHLGAQNGKKSSRGITSLSKEDMELFKATKAVSR